MRVSVIAPLKNEAPWIGYSVMAAYPGIHEFIYAVDPLSDDGSLEILQDLQNELGKDKVRFMADKEFSFDPMDRAAYNNAFNACIEASTGEACFFLHPDMIVENPGVLLDLPLHALAWYTTITSYAGDFQTVISKGRGTKWKNIHRKQFGLHYYGGYGSRNEDFYHSDITFEAHDFHGSNFGKYPFQVADSGLFVNHYCELKSYKRRLEKMRLCMKTQYPGLKDSAIDDMAANHPRVHLTDQKGIYGEFVFERKEQPEIPEVVKKYQSRFESFLKENALV